MSKYSDVFNSKNLYLKHNGTFEYDCIEPSEFFQILFGSCDHRDELCPVYPVEKQMCDEYIAWRA